MREPPQRTALLVLRQGTEAAHAALDATLHVQSRLAEPGLRDALIFQYLAFHRGVEHAIEPHLLPHPGYDFETRRRSPVIEACIASTGIASTGIAGTGNFAPAEPPLAPAASLAAALGIAYVAEGSSLGGRLILRGLADAGADISTLGFMDPYGPRTGIMWKALAALLDHELATPSAQAEAIEGASAGFAFAAACLAPARLASKQASLPAARPTRNAA